MLKRAERWAEPGWTLSWARLGHPEGNRLPAQREKQSRDGQRDWRPDRARSGRQQAAKRPR